MENKKDKTLLWLAGGIGFLGNLSASFLLETAKDAKLAIGIVSSLGFFILLWVLSKGYGKISE
jgi:hypothetical protein